ncbi:MAG: cytochrome c oxidase subunit II [Alphaproteobacteria bacterium]|nr:cytochrome c oxidase subunit II [Alphaproteobacteria bacterium]
MNFKRGSAALASVGTIIGLFAAGAARAQEVVGAPYSWQIGFGPSFTPVMERVNWLHDVLNVTIGVITLFVLGLLVYVMVRFRASRNPTPTTLTHNTVLEIAWTVIPILILVFIAVPSFRLLYYGDKAVDAAFTVKVTGHQWYWTYEYPDHGNFKVESRMLTEADRVKQKPNHPRMMAVDEEMVVPKDAVIRVVGTAADSMHGWTVPGFGLKKTVIPGRLNEGWIQVAKEGFYFGQCSQICGNAHAYMPIAVRVVSKAEFDAWVERKKRSAGLMPPLETDVASVVPPISR